MSVIEGHDEIILKGGAVIAEVHGGKIKSSRLSPKDLGLKKSESQFIRGGDARENARILSDLLQGKMPDLEEVVVANAALAIFAAEKIKSPKASKTDAVIKARESISSGRARQKLEQLIEGSKS